MSPFLAARYLAVEQECEDGSRTEPVECTLEFRSEQARMAETGFFRCSDPELQRIVEACCTTIRLCMVPHYEGNSTLALQPDRSRSFAKTWRGSGDSRVLVDGPRRDREVWVGDLLPMVRTAWIFFGDREVIRNSLQVFLDQSEPDGYMPASSISMQRFHEYNAWFFIVLAEYVMLSGDVSFLGENASRIREAMRYLIGLLEKDGTLVLDRMQTWAWTASRFGRITSSQCVVHDALRAMDLLSGLLGDDPIDPAPACLANRLAEQVRNRGYDPEAGAFTDMLDMGTGGKPRTYSLDANALAIRSGIATPEQAASALRFLETHLWSAHGSFAFFPKETPDGRNWVHNDHIWPFVVGFEAEARFLAGDREKALDLVRKTWGSMLSHGADTFWEIMDGRTGGFMNRRIVDAPDDRDTWNSACHGWSTAPAFLLPAYLGGVLPTSPGYRSLRLDPHPMGIDRIEVRVPGIDGPVGLLLERQEDFHRMTLEIPEGTECRWNGESDVILSDGSTRQRGSILEAGTYWVRL